MSEKSDLEFIKKLCIINYLEIQDMRRKLDIPETKDDDANDYLNSIPQWLNGMEKRITKLSELLV